MENRNNYPPIGGWPTAQYTSPRQEHDEQVEREAMAHRIDRERDMALMTDNEREVMRMQAEASVRAITARTSYADGSHDHTHMLNMPPEIEKDPRYVTMFGGRGTGKNIDFRQVAIGEMIQFLQRNGYKVTKSKR